MATGRQTYQQRQASKKKRVTAAKVERTFSKAVGRDAKIKASHALRRKRSAATAAAAATPKKSSSSQPTGRSYAQNAKKRLAAEKAKFLKKHHKGLGAFSAEELWAIKNKKKK